MTYAEHFHDAVLAWVRPYKSLFQKYGHDLDDVAQECRLAILEQEAYLEKLHGEGGNTLAAAKTLALRAAKRRLLGRSKAGPEVFDTGPNGWTAVHAMEAAESDTSLRITLAEMIDRASSPAVKMYLKEVFEAGALSGKDLERCGRFMVETVDLRRHAAEYLLLFFATYHWSTEP